MFMNGTAEAGEKNRRRTNSDGGERKAAVVGIRSPKT
jgi:hypothetical protein